MSEYTPTLYEVRQAFVEYQSSEPGDRPVHRRAFARFVKDIQDAGDVDYDDYNDGEGIEND